MRMYSHQTMTIAQAAALSDAVDNTEGMAMGFVTPSALEATTNIGFKVSHDGVTFVPLYDNAGSLVNVAVAVNAARGYQIPDAVRFWPYFKIWAQNGSGTDVDQATAARTFTVVSLV